MGTVGGGGVGGETVASASGHSNWSYHSNKDHHGAHNDKDVDADTGPGAVLLLLSSGSDGLD